MNYLARNRSLRNDPCLLLLLATAPVTDYFFNSGSMCSAK
jgi:hypothetical protein